MRREDQQHEDCRFRGLDLERLAAVMHNPVMLDRRNLYLPGDLQRTSFTCHRLGRAVVTPAGAPA